MNFASVFVTVVSFLVINDSQGKPSPKWSAWGACSTTCGDSGVRTRSQQCPSNNCDPPVSNPPATETQSCNRQACQANTTATTSTMPSTQTSATSNALGTATTSTMPSTQTSATSNALGITTSTVPSTQTSSTSDSPGTTINMVSTVTATTSAASTPETDTTPAKTSTAPTRPQTTKPKTTKITSLAPEEEDVSDGTLTVDAKFTPALKDETSSEFRKLKTECEDLLKAAFANETGVLRCTVTGFSQGSIIIQYKIYVRRSSQYTSARLTRTLDNAVKQNKVRTNLKVTSVSITMRSRINNPGKTNNKKFEITLDETVESYWFFLYGMGAMTAMVLVFITICIAKNRINRNENPKTEEIALPWLPFAGKKLGSVRSAADEPSTTMTKQSPALRNSKVMPLHNSDETKYGFGTSTG